MVALLPPATKLGQDNIFTGVCDSVNREGGASSKGCCSQGGGPGGDPPPGTATVAAGTHPTGMYSCWLFVFGLTLIFDYQ